MKFLMRGHSIECLLHLPGGSNQYIYKQIQLHRKVRENHGQNLQVYKTVSYFLPKELTRTFYHKFWSCFLVSVKPTVPSNKPTHLRQYVLNVQ